MSKKWKGNSLILDPVKVYESRKKLQEKFSIKSRKIRKYIYLGLGICVIALSIGLPVGLLLPSSSKTTEDTKEYPRVAPIDNPDDLIVKFNESLVNEGETNANDYKKGKLYDELAASVTSRITLDIYSLIVTRELSSFTKLGSYATLFAYVSEQLLNLEIKKATDAKENYLDRLMAKGFGSSNVLVDSEKLKEAKSQYQNSLEFKLQVVSNILSMIYIASDKSRFESAAIATSLKEIWYLRTSFSGANKELLSKKLSKNVCEPVEERPIIWGRIDFTHLSRIVKLSDVYKLYYSVFNEPDDIRTVTIEDELTNEEFNNKLMTLISSKVEKYIERSTKTQVVNAIKAADADSNFLLTENEKNSLTPSSSWEVIQGILYRSVYKAILSAALNDETFKDDFIKEQMKQFNERIDAQASLFNYATTLGLNPTSDQSDEELRIEIKDKWKTTFSTVVDSFLDYTDDDIRNVFTNFDFPNKEAPLDEETTLETIFTDFLELVKLSELSTFETTLFQDSLEPSAYKIIYNKPFLELITARIKNYLNDKYSDEEKQSYVEQFKDNPAFDNNANTWDRLAIFLTRVLVKKYQDLLAVDDNKNSYITSEKANLASKIASWDLEKLKSFANEFSITYIPEITAENLRIAIANNWESNLQNKVNTFVNLNLDVLRTNIIEDLIQDVDPLKECGTLDNWNTYVLDSSINLDEKYASIREKYGNPETRKFGYLGIVRETKAPSLLNDTMKKVIFRSTTGSDPFKPGLQERQDFDGTVKPYFIKEEDDTVSAVFLIAKNIDKDKLSSDNDDYDIDYVRYVLFQISNTSNQYITNARKYFFDLEKYRAFFYDDDIQRRIGTTLNPNSNKNPTKNSVKDPTKT